MKFLLARLGNKCIKLLILGAVFIGTLLFGGKMSWGLAAVFGQLAVACCLWAALRLWASPTEMELHRARRSGRQLAWIPPLHGGSRMIWVMLPLCAGYFILQILPLPADLVQAISPQRALLSIRVQEGLGLPPAKWVTLSIHPESTRQALVLFVLAVLAFWAGLYAGTHRYRARRIVRGLLFLVLFEAAYGLLENLTNHDYVLWIPSLRHAASGTFINRNHYAAFLALFAPLAIGWFFFRASEPVYFKGFDEYRSLGFWEILSSRRALWLLVPAVLLLGVIQSASRGGFSSIILGVALFFAFNIRGLTGRTLAWLAALMGLVLIVYGLSSEYELVMGRLGTMTKDDYVEGRVIVWRDSMKMLRDFPLFGVGLGNFGPAFKPYASMDTYHYSAQAHNEWLEALLTLGVTGFTLFMLLLLGLIQAIVHNIRRADRDQLWMLGGACGLAGLAVHCIVDFNFHIPAIVLTASLLIGILAGFQPRQSSAHARPVRTAD